MSEPVPRVEGKGRSEDSFSGVFNSFWQTTDELNDVRTVKSAWCDEVCKREAIKDL